MEGLFLSLTLGIDINFQIQHFKHYFLSKTGGGFKKWSPLLTQKKLKCKKIKLLMYILSLLSV